MDTDTYFKKLLKDKKCSNCGKNINPFKFSCEGFNFAGEGNKWFCNYQCRTWFKIKND